MQIVATVSERQFNDAIRAARDVGVDLLPEDKLNVQLFDRLKERAAQVWDHIEDALRTARHRGMEVARSVIDAAKGAVDQALAEAGEMAGQLKDLIAAKLQEYIDRFIDAALAHVRSSVKVGEVEFRIAKVTIEQKILLHGELKASIEELCAMTAGGELAIGAEYGTG
jgi:hypothetical protein